MIAILTDKPNVGKEIARILGAHTREDGYMSGNGYMVTWTFGNMLSLAMPKDYGMDRPERGDFPINPAPFRLMVKHIRTDTGWIPDINAVLQLKVIEKVFDACESIIAATDASREGEMVFRYLYRYLECRKPYRRLWISSLTDEAVLEGMGSLRPGSLYDRMFLAADSRNKADWVLGLNASYALCQATGTGNNSLGRVQTPVLAAISSRYRERENHIATDTFPVFISLCKNNTLLKMRCTEEFTDREAAARLYSDCKLAGHARVTAVSRQIREIEPPALYNLTELQKDANNYYGMTAGKSLEIAQRLYEKKLISYPRTGSRYIPEDVMAHIPVLLEKIVAMPEFREYGHTFDFSGLNTGSVDNAKVTDHHALIITGIVPQELSEAESAVYTLIAGRMLEAFSPRCEKESLKMECVCEGMDFRSQSAVIVNPGWRAVFSRKEDREKDEPEGNGGTAVFAEGEEIPVMGYGLAQKKTLPRPLYTEATLLTAMENCGKEIADGQAREAVKELGIGTPATRAAIITTLFKRDYIERSGKSIRPTEKGLYLYESVKGMMVADAELTGTWEKALAQIEGHTLDPESFMLSIREYTGKVTGEILRLKFPEPSSHAFTCPKCKTGNVIVKAKVAKCDHEGCGLLVFRRFLNKELTDQHLEQLFSSGSTRLIKGVKGKKGASFDAAVAFDADFNLKLSFPKPKGGKGK